VVVLMGVAGSGKSTVGPDVAARLGVGFFDGDDYHSDDEKALMHAAIPLDDQTRAPWLARLRDVVREHRHTGMVLACSALKRRYRDALAAGAGDVVFVALDAPRDVLLARLAHRQGHFAGPELLDSQLRDLELGPDVTLVDADAPVDVVVTRVVEAVAPRAG
jgi:carbohydrate kinase (thermoresistant glucokinase family)